MTKMELIEKVAQEAKVKKAQAKRAVESVIKNVIDSLKSGSNITLSGLGTFRVKDRKARTARNPKTGETIQVPAGKRVSFKASVGLKKKVR